MVFPGTTFLAQAGNHLPQAAKRSRRFLYRFILLETGVPPAGSVQARSGRYLQFSLCTGEPTMFLAVYGSDVLLVLPAGASTTG